MDYRRDVLPPLLALALSGALHAGLGWWSPGPEDRSSPAEPVPVVVEYRPGEGDGEPGAQAPGEEPGEPEPSEHSPGPSQPPDAPLPPTGEIAEGPPPRPVDPRPAPRRTRPEPDLRAAPEESAPAPEHLPPTPESVPAPRPEPPPPVPLADLLPRAGDLRPYTQASPPPDPAGGEEREATLTLEDADIRYKGYLGQVQASIDRTWRWKEAMLAARGGGKVLVRFSLAPEGAVEDVQVVESSGSALLDWEAAEAVRRAFVPPYPRHWTIERLHLFAQFVYRLE
jgi:periplasmic protein TonB